TIPLLSTPARHNRNRRVRPHTLERLRHSRRGGTLIEESGRKPAETQPMSRKTPKTAVVAFKVEAELAEFLNKLPNKSAFIRKAIAAQLSMACPLCNGTGVVPRGVHDHFAPLISQLSSRHCDGCGDELPLPRDPGDL